MKKTFAIIIIIFPWKLRRFILIKIWKYKIHPTAKIGFSYIYPVYLEMGPKSKIGHFNVAIHLEKLIIGENSSISRPMDGLTAREKYIPDPFYSSGRITKQMLPRILLGIRNKE